MFDYGSQVTLATRKCAELIDAKATGVSSIEVIGIGSNKTSRHRVTDENRVLSLFCAPTPATNTD